MRTHRIVIGVMGPAECDAAEAALAGAVGAAVAERGAVLLTGGRGGVMAAAAAGARAAGGLTIGVLPGASAAATPPNPDIDIALFTGLGEARNWINVCASDAVIAIGGGWGTLSEIALAVKAGRPVIALRSWPIAAPEIQRAASAEDAVALAFAATAAG
jgi:uncharacterized protein (TIGR00725 family)